MNHGILFYGLFWLIARKKSFRWRMVATMLTGVIWEVGENTDFVINRFREVTMSLDCYGDFHLVTRWPTACSCWPASGWQALFRSGPLWPLCCRNRAYTTLMVRDGLALNTLVLIAPIEAVKDWQLQGWTQT